MKRTHILAILVAVAVVALAVFTLVSNLREPGPTVVTVTASPTEPASTAQPAQPSTTVPTQPARVGQCPETPAGPFNALTTAPDTTWELVRNTALPRSSAGPAIVDGEVRRCYAHSAEGALLAAANIVTRLDIQAVVDQQYTPGPVKDSFTKQNQENPGPRLYPVQIAGFSLVTVSPEMAQVQLVLRNTNNALTAGTVLVVWDSGDWKVNGTVSPPPSAQVDSLAGFVSWSGVN